MGELAGRYESALLGLASGVLGGREDLAMDAVQEAWVRVIRFGGGFQGKSSVKTWLYRIVINQCRNMMAARGMDRITTSLHGRASPGLGDSASPSARAEGDGARRNGTVGSALRAAAEADELRELREAVGRLGEEKQELVLLCYHAGLTHEDAAAVLEVPVGTLKSRLHSALGQLREAMAAKEGRA
jgi:RNA polymerase sigma-70 factor (ECF subfamily)